MNNKLASMLQQMSTEVIKFYCEHVCLFLRIYKLN